jgi:hypothetical protein
MGCKYGGGRASKATVIQQSGAEARVSDGGSKRGGSRRASTEPNLKTAGPDDLSLP